MALPGGSKFAAGRTAGLRSRFGGQVSQSVSITMEPGGAELAAGMERWAELVGDFSEAWPAVTRLVRRHHGRTFDSEGAATGPKRRWVPLSPRYAAIKARDFPGRPLLVRTTALRRALVEGGPGSRVRETKDSVEIGVTGDVGKIAGYHQKGTPRMPARPPVQFDRSLANKNSLPFVVSQILQRIIVDHRKAALGANAGVLDADVLEKRLGSLDRLSRRGTE